MTGTPSESRRGRLYVVPTPIGNPDDISLRALRVLAAADVIAAEDTRRARQLLVHHGLWKEGSTRQLLSYFDGNEASRTAALIARLRAGDTVALVSDAGLPCLSDPGARLIQMAIQDGIDVDVLPGPFAAATAFVGSGIDAESFEFVGFLPREDQKRNALLAAWARRTAALVFYESPRRVEATLRDCAQHVPLERPLCLARELTKTHQEYRRGTLEKILQSCIEQPPLGEVTVVLAGAAETVEVVQDAVDEEIRRRLLRGESPKEIAAVLAIQWGKSKTQVYQAALLLRRRLDVAPTDDVSSKKEKDT